jgi:hypothetical protein
VVEAWRRLGKNYRSDLGAEEEVALEAAGLEE